MPQEKLKLLNWNIAGAKYLELRPSDSKKSPPPEQDKTRDVFRTKLNDALRKLIERHDPDIITLQEICGYEPNGLEKNAKHVIEEPNGYKYFPHWMIDTKHHSATGKWVKVREKG